MPFAARTRTSNSSALATSSVVERVVRSAAELPFQTRASTGADAGADVDVESVWQWGPLAENAEGVGSALRLAGTCELFALAALPLVYLRAQAASLREMQPLVSLYARLVLLLAASGEPSLVRVYPYKHE